MVRDDFCLKNLEKSPIHQHPLNSSETCLKSPDGVLIKFLEKLKVPFFCAVQPLVSILAFYFKSCKTLNLFLDCRWKTHKTGDYLLWSDTLSDVQKGETLAPLPPNWPTILPREIRSRAKSKTCPDYNFEPSTLWTAIWNRSVGSCWI